MERIRDNMTTRATVRAGRFLAVFVLACWVTACDGLLDVDNPAAIEAGDLDDPRLVPFIANGVVGEFQRAFNTVVYRGGSFSDELVGGHLAWYEPLWDQREIDAAHPVNSTVYADIHAARGAADSMGTRIERLLGDSASRSMDLATVMAHGGYAYVLLAEHFCSSPIDMSAPYTPAELFLEAAERFERAITIATAAKGAGAAAAKADQLINLARVGAARAYLGFGESAKAVQQATQVPATFEWFAEYTDNAAGVANQLSAATEASDLRTALEPPLDTVGDPRIPAGSARQRLPDGRMMYVPWTPYSFSGWNPASPAPIARNSSIRLASGLEARYILAELGELSNAELRQFIDARRAIGNQGGFTGSDAELPAELREQRRRDLFLTGHRLGDLRRYKAKGIDDFPRGAVPGFQDRVYDDQECLLISQQELSANPKAHN